MKNTGRVGRFLLWALVALLVAAGAADAQETTGAIRGAVADEYGTPIAGALISATGPLGTVSAVSDSQGTYRFPRVAAGDYTLVSKVDGFLDATAAIRVSLGEATTVDFTMQKSFSEEITVVSETVVIDFTESQTETSIGQREIDYLPRGRNYTDVVSFAAGTVDDRQAGGISIDGASGLENRYIVDGLDATDPQVGDVAVPLRAEFMEEVQVKSAGYMAEFGGSTGGVVNVITRSGGNEFHGAVLVDYANQSWNGSERPVLEYALDGPQAQNTVYRKDDEVRFDPGFVLSGPILKDRLWFFASYQPGLQHTERTVHFTDGFTDTYEQDLRVNYASLNLTANLGSSLLLKLGANVSPYTKDGLLPDKDGRSGISDQEAYAPLGEDDERETYSFNADWIVADNFIVSGRAGWYHTNATDTGIPFYDTIHNYSTYSIPGFVDRHPEIPDAWQQNPGFYSNPLHTATEFDTYERTAGGLDASWYFEAAGEHSFKFGYQTEKIYNNVIDGYNADRILYYWDRAYTTTSGESVSGSYGYFRLLNINTAGEVESRNQSIFVQDSWSVLPNLTVNLGVRAEKEAVPNYGAAGPDPAIAFGFGDKIAPRLGFAWDIKNDATWKLYGSWGTYYDVTKYELPRGSFGGDRWVDFYFTFDTADPGLNTPGNCSTGNNTIFDNPQCGAGTLIEAVDRRFNSADPLYQEIFGKPGIDPNIKPMESWELQLGLDHQLTPTIQVGARYVHKELVRAIEDLGFLFPGVGEVYVIGNPGEGMVAEADADGLTFPKAVREYDALELTFEKRFSDRWSLRAYYTLSRLWGNYSGLANSDEQNSFGGGARLSPNASRLFDTITSMYGADGQHVFGRLATDRPHQFGAQLLYNFDFGLAVGVTQYVGSGTPRSEIASVPIDSVFYPLGRGNLGRTPWLSQTDLSLWQRFSIGSRLGFSVGLTVLNLFDSDTATRYWGTRVVQDLPVTNADFVTGFDYSQALAEIGPDGLDTAFNMPDNFQSQREVRLTFKLEF